MDAAGKKKVFIFGGTGFLGYYSRECGRKVVDDYLGMEAWFVYDPVQKTFSFDGFDTDAI